MATRALQRFTNKLDAWSVEKRLTSTNKTVNIIFRKRNEELMEITLINKIIYYKESISSWGMTLASKLNWEKCFDSESKSKKA